MNLNFSIQEICEILGVSTPLHNLSTDFVIQNVVIDSRSPRITAKSVFVALSGMKNDGHNYREEFWEKGGKIAIVKEKQQKSEGLEIQVDNTLAALQKLAIAHRNKFNYPVIGITGSNGKTITKEWLYHLTKNDFNVVRSPKSYNSQVGVALSVLAMTSHHNLAIFEAGISEPGEMEILKSMIQPTIGVFTGLGDAHDAAFESREQKRKEKFKLFSAVEKLINVEELEQIDFFLPFHEKASIANATTAYHTAIYLGLNKEEVKAKLQSLPTISMRLEQLQGKNNCLLLNDAYTADIAGLEIALRHLNHVAEERKKVLILSLSDEQLKLTEEDAFLELFGTLELSDIVFIGSKNVLKQANIPCKYYKTVEDYLEYVIDFHSSAILFKGSRENSLERLVHYYSQKTHVTQLQINFSAMRHNLNFFKSQLSPEVKMMVMVKAQSYGTGLVEISKFLEGEGVDYLGVAYADEGVQLRKAGIHLPIIVMNPEKAAFEDIIDYKLEPSLYSMNILNAFIHYLILKQKTAYPIHIKIDTGMNRLGFIQSELNELMDMLQAQPEVFVKTVFSHLAVSEEVSERSFNYKQMRTFEIMTGEMIEKMGYTFDRHLANSSAVLNFKNTHFDMVRLGIGIYGLVPGQKKTLENVLTFVTEISQIKVLKEGDSLGYGRGFIASEMTTVGIIPVGYADGLRRGLSKGNWEVIIHGEKARVLGNICMDMCMVDITKIEAGVGDKVQIFGEENPIFEMAKNLYTIPYEIISSISSRVHRVYLD
ncbi:MAG: alanine racemase [Crocinitomicaceae bacterium]